MKEDELLVIVNKKDRQILYKNNNLYFHGNKISYKIVEDRKVLMKKSSLKYYEIMLNVKMTKDNQYNDLIEFSIQDEKRKIINLIKTIWEGD